MYAETETHTETGFYIVSPYLIDRAYGGPEEGGWYYECGEPVQGRDLPLPVACRTMADARKAHTEMEKALARLNEGRPSINSVLSQGRYSAAISDGWPKPYPQRVPHYE